MSEDPRPEDELDLTAAEYVLGLLEGEALMEARGRVSTSPAFAAAVGAWEERMAPLLQAVTDAQPDPALWERIVGKIDAQPALADTVVELRRRERIWRGVAAGTTALAASLALVIALRAPDQPPPPPQTVQQAPTYVASLASEEGATALTVAFEGSTGSLLVSPARLTGAAGHDHELWLLPPAGAAPISLGLVRAGGPQRVRVPERLVGQMQANASVALSVEPTGGSPTGLPTGPVIASGPLVRI